MTWNTSSRRVSKYSDLEKEYKRLDDCIPTDEMRKFKSDGTYNGHYIYRLALYKAVQYEIGAHRRGSLGEDQESILI